VHWSYAATRWLDAATVRILDCNEVIYTGLAHRHRDTDRAAPFAVAASVRLVLARRVQRAFVRRARTDRLFLNLSTSNPYRDEIQCGTILTLRVRHANN